MPGPSRRYSAKIGQEQGLPPLSLGEQSVDSGHHHDDRAPGVRDADATRLVDTGPLGTGDYLSGYTMDRSMRIRIDPRGAACVGRRPTPRRIDRLATSPSTWERWKGVTS
jgi:hypothetical protein